MFSITAFNKKLQSRPLSLTKDERGLTTVEYVILLVLIAVGSIGVWKTFGTTLATKLGGAGQQITDMK
jgi:Flp pilus assembly pilin Flp